MLKIKYYNRYHDTQQQHANYSLQQACNTVSHVQIHVNSKYKSVKIPCSTVHKMSLVNETLGSETETETFAFLSETRPSKKFRNGDETKT